MLAISQNQCPIFSGYENVTDPLPSRNCLVEGDVHANKLMQQNVIAARDAYIGYDRWDPK